MLCAVVWSVDISSNLAASEVAKSCRRVCTRGGCFSCAFHVAKLAVDRRDTLYAWGSHACRGAREWSVFTISIGWRGLKESKHTEPRTVMVGAGAKSFEERHQKAALLRMRP
jgi:hypothetical protein